MLLILFLGALQLAGQNTISGKLTDADGGEEIPYATIYVKGTNIGTVTNDYGFYSLTVPDKYIENGIVTIAYGFLGYETIEQQIDLGKTDRLDVKLAAESENLEEVVVEAKQSTQKVQLQSTELSTTRLQVKEIKKLPSFAGETDILKVMQLLPGVQAGAQGSTDVFVRGGDADQNLVLLDEATVYNVGHLFGFFSVFNSDAIKDMTMIKGGFPANFGGRLSSMLDIKMREGHDESFHATGGIGLLSSKLTLEGPIVKEKVSFLISGRRTYLDKVAGLFDFDVPYYFYDVNGKINYKINSKNRLFYSIYLGNDIMGLDESGASEDSEVANADLDFGFGFNLGNLTHTLRWNHIYNSKLFSNLTFVNTNFKYDIKGDFLGNNILIQSDITDYGIKADFDYYKSAENHIEFGVEGIQHAFNPNVVSSQGAIANVFESSEGQNFRTQEIAAYALSDLDITSKIKVKYGVRFSSAFAQDKFYYDLEPRLAARYLLNEHDAIKLSYSRMNQYMHRVSSSTIALPTDLWYPVTSTIKPQRSDQISMGYNHLFEKSKILVTAEGYYKKMDNLIEYKEGANIILNEDFEQEMVQGEGESYGAELLVKKEEGKLTGWLSYALAWSTRDFDELNNGKAFFAKYDRRHNTSIVLNYKPIQRITISALWVYQTGSRYTAITGQYVMPNSTLTGIDVIPIYSTRNAIQMSASHRLDLSVTLHSKASKKLKSDWSIGVYNLYNQTQPYAITVAPKADGTGYQYEQPGLFGLIPSISYNFKF